MDLDRVRGTIMALNLQRVVTLGDAESRQRCSHETRKATLQRLMLVRAELGRARQRLAKRQHLNNLETRVHLLTR